MIECEGVDSCNGATITVINTGDDTLFIDTVQCIDIRSCQNTIFAFHGSVVVLECECSVGSGCDTITGIDCLALSDLTHSPSTIIPITQHPTSKPTIILTPKPTSIQTSKPTTMQTPKPTKSTTTSNPTKVTDTACNKIGEQCSSSDAKCCDTENG